MGFDVAATCVETNGQLATTIDSTIPAEDAAFYYLIRAANACGLGLLGTATDGSERLAPRCP
jgi:hypothetical protein